MGDTEYERFDPLFSDADADAIMNLCEAYGGYGMYSEEATSEPFGEDLQQRHDAVLNFLKSGGRFGREEDLGTLARRTNYFRETYAYAEPVVDGIEPFLHHDGFISAARMVHDASVVEPAIVYANLLVPGQELAVHTDVPEFRGASRMNQPQWLLVAAHHSGLFERWRMRIATAVAWFGQPEGGEFVFYPEGPFGPPVEVAAKHNSAIVLDTDSVFHGVDRVAESRSTLPELQPGMTLGFGADGAWTLVDGETEIARFAWNDLRFSVSWKAYCYASEEEQSLARSGRDDLDRDTILDTLEENLRERGKLEAERPADTDFALTIIEEYIRFPPPTPPTPDAPVAV
jgi:hypothetical protein